MLRPSGPWTPSVHAFLNHLRQAGFEEAPRPAGSGFAPDGREAVYYVEGEFVHPGPWSDEALIAVGSLLRRLHDASASFVPAPDAVWKPWFLRELGGPNRVIGHGDAAPWNTVTRNGMPVALIDWEYAGPVDPIVELARVCWLFPQLHDDDVAERVGLPPLSVRARQLRLLVDAYGASAEQRGALFERIVEVVVRETAEEAIDRQVAPDSVGPLWGFAWRARSAAWMLRNRAVLERALR
ncbi:phosphotransferase [Paenibacillus flagellatus]|uniref:phosphotransferase n=1 Tax=Paenibacillus flagellatus TaxID=2211139 RepID=UPI001FE74172|nr:phosphotransferase [Paenibacillus flagellatus]